MYPFPSFAPQEEPMLSLEYNPTNPGILDYGWVYHPGVTALGDCSPLNRPPTEAETYVVSGIEHPLHFPSTAHDHVAVPDPSSVTHGTEYRLLPHMAFPPSFGPPLAFDDALPHLFEPSAGAYYQPDFFDAPPALPESFEHMISLPDYFPEFFRDVGYCQELLPPLDVPEPNDSRRSRPVSGPAKPSKNVKSPLANPLTMHNKSRLYLDCLEKYLKCLHDLLRSRGIDPVPLGRVNEYEGLSTISFRTILYHLTKDANRLESLMNHEKGRAADLKRRLKAQKIGHSDNYIYRVVAYSPSDDSSTCVGSDGDVDGLSGFSP